MRNLLCRCSFCGTNYRGFQVQVEQNTICNMLQNAIEKVFLTRYDIKGCSRTDSKVHANEFYFNFLTGQDSVRYPAKNVPRALNTFLPHDIVVTDCREVAPDFHARYCCTGKEYVYLIRNTPYRDPFYDGRAFFYNRPMDAEKLNQAAKQFIGTFDYSAFCSKNCDIEARVRTIFDFTVRREQNNVLFTVSGDGFLYNMVRIMVGTLLRINEGFLSDSDIPGIIASKQRKNAGLTAQPEGLYLNRVFYEQAQLGRRLPNK